MRSTKPSLIMGRIHLARLAATPSLTAMLAMLATPADAQNAEATEASAIVITASRASRSGFEAPTPTTILSAAELLRTGEANVADALNQVPAFSASRTPTTSSGQSQNVGGNFLDLRGLGPSRTLILVDGRRHVPTTQDGLVDLNVIPSALIERVEVVTGGASAAWGSDAVAGVVNLIFRRNFDGIEGSLQAGISDKGDSGEYRGTLAFGTNFAAGRGNLMVGGEIYDNKGILDQSDRDWGRRGYQLVANPAFAPGNGEPARLIARTTVGVATEGGLILSGPLRGTQFGPGGEPQPFQFGTPVGPFQIGGGGTNMGLYRPIQLPLERQNIYGRLSYDLTDDIRAFVDGSYARAESSNAFVQPFDFGRLTIRADNPFLPATVRNQLLAAGQDRFAFGRINTDFGFFTATAKNETVRGVLGLEGDLGNGWGWDAHYEYGRTRYHGKILNNRIEQRFALAVDAVADPVTGNPICRSTLADPGNGCVPVNLFGSGSPSAEALAYFSGTQSLVSRFRQHSVAANLDGEPFSTWAGPVSIAAGVEYRRQELDTAVDALSAAQAFFVGNPPPIHPPALEVKEGYLETIVPLLSDLPFVNALELNGAVRFTDYSTSGGVTTWKLGLTHEVSKELRLRATRSRDIRAPNLIELFTGRQLAFDAVIDPANGEQTFIPTPTSGNPALEPEKAKTWTVGFVYEPSWIPGFRAAVDYYDIKLSGAISTLDAQDIVDRCFAGALDLCELVSRDSSGALIEVRDSFINLAELRTKGFDIEASYTTPLSAIVESWQGDLSLRILATYVKDLITDDGLAAVDRAGDVGTDLGGVPHWRWNASLTYDRGPFTWHGEGRYVGPGNIDHRTTINDNHVKARFYLDTSVEMEILDDEVGKVSLFGAVRNLLDKDPPNLPSSSVAPLATNGALYDVVGRYFTVGVRIKH